MKRLLLFLTSLAGCGSSSLAAVVPIHGDQDSVPMSLEGTVLGIDFQNINIARGRYTYNVELRIGHEGIPGSSHEADLAPGEFRVRVHKVYWSQLEASEQAELAPDGPKHTMSVKQWRGYGVGERVTLEVASWGPGRGAPLRLDVPTSSAP